MIDALGLRFVVFGRAQGKGSKRALPVNGKHGREIVLVDANKNARPWANQVAGAAVDAYGPGEPLIRDAVHVSMRFYFARPKAHYGRRGNQLPSAPVEMLTMPDLDKLCRNAADALIGVIIKDDAQIAQLSLRKLYGEPERLEITIYEL